MGMSVTVNFEAKKKWDKIAQDFPLRLLAEVNRQTLYFIGTIQRNQMSGRKGNIYLNRQSGTLVSSWFPDTKMGNGVIKTKAYAKNVKYAAIHQYGGTIRRGSRPSGQGMKSPSGAFHMPKRLFIVESFEREMPGRYAKAVEKVFRSFK